MKKLAIQIYTSVLLQNYRGEEQNLAMVIASGHGDRDISLAVFVIECTLLSQFSFWVVISVKNIDFSLCLFLWGNEPSHFFLH